MTTKPEEKYSLIIIGGGPAGMTASVYAARYEIKHLIITENIGGLTYGSHKIENFPSYPEIIGIELVQKMENQVKKLGGKFFLDKVNRIKRKNNVFQISTFSGNSFIAKTILLSYGTERNKLGVKGEKKLTGRGVSYCFTCDADFFKGRIVGIVGGGDSAVRAAIYLAKIARKVFLIYRGNQLKAGEKWQKMMLQRPNIETIQDNEIKEIIGKNHLEKVKLKNLFNRSDELLLDGLFIEIGGSPNQRLIRELSLETDLQGYIKINQEGKTNQRGIWAAGDITTGSNGFRQILTACAEGAIAVGSIHQYLSKMK